MIVGEGNEEIGNMIQNYIKEIEELRYERRPDFDVALARSQERVCNNSITSH